MNFLRPVRLRKARRKTLRYDQTKPNKDEIDLTGFVSKANENKEFVMYDVDCKMTYYPESYEIIYHSGWLTEEVIESILQIKHTKSFRFNSTSLIKPKDAERFQVLFYILANEVASLRVNSNFLDRRCVKLYPCEHLSYLKISGKFETDSLESRFFKSIKHCKSLRSVYFRSFLGHRSTRSGRHYNTGFTLFTHRKRDHYLQKLACFPFDFSLLKGSTRYELSFLQAFSLTEIRHVQTVIGESAIKEKETLLSSSLYSKSISWYDISAKV